MFGFGEKQWVCTVCGYNAIDKRPAQCAFCSAPADKLMEAKRSERHYTVKSLPVSEHVNQLRCAPVLGLDHAAYQINTEAGPVLIDCPAIFCADLEPAKAIFFTHKDFIGAANKYRKAWNCDILLHQADAELSEVCGHSVTERFATDFERHGIKAVHIGGHTPGFTVYVWQDMLFICDFAYPPGTAMKLNPHGQREATREGASRLAGVLENHDLKTVCGYNYTADFDDWQHNFMTLV